MWFNTTPKKNAMHTTMAQSKWYQLVMPHRFNTSTNITQNIIWLHPGSIHCLLANVADGCRLPLCNPFIKVQLTNVAPRTFRKPDPHCPTTLAIGVALMPEFINFCIESSKSTSGRQLFGHLCPSWAAFGLTGFTHSLGPPSITLTTRFHISYVGPPFSLYPVQHRTQQTWFYHAMFPR